jgi:hypothetical protein
MLYIFLLAFFLVQFLVIVGVILFAIFFSRPEVPLKGDGGLERTAVDQGADRGPRQREAESTAGGKDASKDSQRLMKRLMTVRPAVFAALSFPSCGQAHQGSVQGPSWLVNN